MYMSWPLDCPLPTAGRCVPLLYCQKRVINTFLRKNSTLDLALHQMVFALLTAIAIEPVIPGPDPSLVILGLVGSAKQVAEGEIQRRMSSILSFGYHELFSAKALTWQEHCYRQDREKPPLVHRH